MWRWTEGRVVRYQNQRMTSEATMHAGQGHMGGKSSRITVR